MITKTTKFSYIFLLIHLSVQLDVQDLNSPLLFKYEICSYHGTPNVTKKEDKINIDCICDDNYATLESNEQQINGIKVQCSYSKRRRFITFFLAAFIPFGFDYLYLGLYWLFCLIFLLCAVVIFGNCYFFFKYERDKSNETEEDPSTTTKRKIFIVCAFVAILFYIGNLVFIGVGRVKDANDIELIEDLDTIIYFYK